MPTLTFISAYYENPGMLQIQMEHLRKLPLSIRSNMEVIFVDDGSPEPIPEVDATGLNLKIFRIRRDVKWNQDGARNTAAHEASGKWLLFTDIDHLYPKETFETALAMEDDSQIYRFSRQSLGGEPLRSPANLLLITREKYWEHGGYDEDFRGTYGTDILYNARMRAFISEKLLDDLCIRYEREDMPDANTKRYKRNYNRVTRWRWKAVKLLKRLGLKKPINTLREPYDLVASYPGPDAVDE